MKNQRLMAAALALALVSPVVAHAGALREEANGVISMSVQYNDLNLASDAGVDTLLGRLREASKRICHASSPSKLPQLGGAMTQGACVQTTMDRALAGFDHPTVLAAYHYRTSRRAHAW